MASNALKAGATIGVVITLVILLSLFTVVQGQTDNIREQGNTTVTNETVAVTQTDVTLALANAKLAGITQVHNLSNNAVMTVTTHYNKTNDGIVFEPACGCNNTNVNVSYAYRSSDLSSGTDSIIGLLPIVLAAGIILALWRRKDE